MNSTKVKIATTPVCIAVAILPRFFIQKIVSDSLCRCIPGGRFQYITSRLVHKAMNTPIPRSKHHNLVILATFNYLKGSGEGISTIRNLLQTLIVIVCILIALNTMTVRPCTVETIINLKRFAECLSILKNLHRGLGSVHTTDALSRAQL